MTVIKELGMKAQKASKLLLPLTSAEKNDFLDKLAKDLILKSEYLISENKKDLEKATENGISDIMIDRLRLTKEGIEAISEAVKLVAELADPIGQVINGYTNLDNLKILQKRVPLGVIAMIFESRPNVCVDAFSLAFKTNNAIILRGGKDALHSNMALVSVIKNCLKEKGITEDAIQLVEDTSHALAEELMQAVDYVDVLIPRGGARLIQTVKEKAKVPVIETGVGNVHIYVDETADFDMAIQIIKNAKLQRPSVCNAAESLVIHKNIAERFIPALEDALKDGQDIEFRVDNEAHAFFKKAQLANEEDFYAEFLDYIMSVKLVSDLEEAISWINDHSTHHSESIITQSVTAAERFQDLIDSAAVYVNASTRFTDGFVFGLGAEIGISTQKLHARGPMGLEALTSSKYYINGNGQIRN